MRSSKRRAREKYTKQRLWQENEIFQEAGRGKQITSEGGRADLLLPATTGEEWSKNHNVQEPREHVEACLNVDVRGEEDVGVNVEETNNLKCDESLNVQGGGSTNLQAEEFDGVQGEKYEIVHWMESENLWGEESDGAQLKSNAPTQHASEELTSNEPLQYASEGIKSNAHCSDPQLYSQAEVEEIIASMARKLSAAMDLQFGERMTLRESHFEGRLLQMKSHYEQVIERLSVALS